MKPSIFTRVYIQSYGRETFRTNEEVVRKLYELGFETQDINFNWGIKNNPDFILRGDNWQHKVEAVANIAQSLGVRFSQAHLPFIKGCALSCDPSFTKSGYKEYFEECVRRAYIACGMLGVNYVTAHPITCDGLNYEREASLRFNREYYDKYVELGIRDGVGTAFENMMPCLDSSLATRYCQHYDELIELVDSYNTERVAICWDTGHANGMMFDQRRAILALGKRLKNLHVNDNIRCNRDEHLLPFMGDIDWYAFTSALAEIGYDGDMTLETHVGIDSEGELQDEMIKLSLKTAQRLVDMFNEAKSQLQK